jgi:hypothetical protein
MRVQVYWNIRKRLWSVRHAGRVIHRLGVLYLRNCKFTVQQGGRERMVREQVKNIHAFVDGDFDPQILAHVDISDMLRRNTLEVTYNPYKHETFVFRDCGTQVFDADLVILTRTYQNGKYFPMVFVPNPGIKVALTEYGNWHLPTLKKEYKRLVGELQRVNPEGGLAWGVANSMKLAIDNMDQAFTDAPRV